MAGVDPLDFVYKFKNDFVENLQEKNKLYNIYNIIVNISKYNV